MKFKLLFLNSLQVILPVNLLCYDLLDLFCDRGDGRFVLKERKFKRNINSIYYQILIKLFIKTITKPL